MRWTVVAMVLALAGCGEKSSAGDQLADLNAQDALDRITALSGRVEELESQLSDMQIALQNETAERQTEIRNDALDREAEIARLDSEIANVEARVPY